MPPKIPATKVRTVTTEDGKTKDIKTVGSYTEMKKCPKCEAQVVLFMPYNLLNTCTKCKYQYCHKCNKPFFDDKGQAFHSLYDCGQPAPVIQVLTTSPKLELAIKKSEYKRKTEDLKKLTCPKCEASVQHHQFWYKHGGCQKCYHHFCIDCKAPFFDKGGNPIHDLYECTRPRLPPGMDRDEMDDFDGLKMRRTQSARIDGPVALGKKSRSGGQGMDEQPCPNCRSVVVNQKHWYKHAFCMKCKHHFCWDCKKPFFDQGKPIHDFYKCEPFKKSSKQPAIREEDSSSDEGFGGSKKPQDQKSELAKIVCTRKFSKFSQIHEYLKDSQKWGLIDLLHENKDKYKSMIKTNLKV